MGPREILIILLIVLLLFGAPKLPQLARSLGQSLRILKDETSSLTDDKKSDADTDKPATSSSDEPRDGQK
ncbi:twin-arginine translocase TatA/TatE family subunit [Demequina sp. SYSU T00192]|uniref:Sec-independent protein translocase protein TatA n=1 Tax=Demequina litoralis TaxID=3051660 RepID=A0ABT8G5P9_9MICO|nr:twin-arginine translocase TatA/TatE family subunit [Demequina sp. SYSU T00192]MDN4474455.1 twin-arginine translocase TatA/TatE family subunit [Demequina sp. SYSU T00192]